MKLWHIAALLCGLHVTAAGAQTRVLDTFESAAPWKAVASDGVKAALSLEPGHDGQALRLDFDFGGAGGYAVARRQLPIEFGANYEIALWIKGDAPVNNFEFKLVDASGDNVWWARKPNFAAPHEWQRIVFRKRHVDFAWGPRADHTLRATDSLELVVSAGKEGGKGTLWFDDLTFRALPAPGPLPQPRITSAGQQVSPSLLARGTRWRAQASQSGAGLTIDFGAEHEVGGLILHWAPGLHARSYDVDASDDGKTWHPLRHVAASNGGQDPLRLGEVDTRYLRLSLRDPAGAQFGLDRVEVMGLDFGSSANAFVQALAKRAPAGEYPRAMSGKQSYWTLLGVDGGSETGLFSEDGVVEAARGGLSLEPFVIEGGKRYSWASVRATQSLREGYLPIPSATWVTDGWQLRTTAFAAGVPGASQLVARYELRNTGKARRTLKLALAVRPFQVNPPTQFLNTEPGVSPIQDLRWTGQVFEVNGRARVRPLSAPAAAGVAPFDSGAFPARLAQEDWDAAKETHDDTGLASGAMIYAFTLDAGARAHVDVVLPLEGEAASAADAEELEQQTAAFWRARLNKVTLALPPAAGPLADVVRSSLAHILMTRDGAMLRPGTRSYARSWIRDGAMMSEALLRLGAADVARDYAEWYGPYQFANGKIPCCVDHRGADPVPENDSQGEYIFLAGQLWQYTHDRALLDAMWPRVRAAAAYMEQQRQSQRDAAHPPPLYGLLPASISHEGYSAKPMHSHWDNFWGLRGYRDAAMLAGVLGHHEDARSFTAQADEFQHDIVASLRETARQHKIGYLAGAAELGDFDATSTTIGLSPGGLQQELPQDLLHRTFQRYWTQFIARRDGKLAWKDYTPYELRNVAAFVRLGWRERAQELLNFFYADRRPQAWNGWAEVVGRDPREPRFIGDMPHGWISSDYIRSALDLFAYVRSSDQAVLLADGVPRAWLDGAGVRIANLQTPFGAVGFAMRAQGRAVTLDIDAASGLPPGGYVLRAPDRAWMKAHATLNGKPLAWRDGELRIDTLPARLIIDGVPAAPTRNRITQ